MSYNFWVIILVQFVIFLFLYVRHKRLRTSLPKILLLSAGAGLIVGLLFDVIVGSLGVFSYNNLDLEKNFYSTGLSLYQLIINGIFSYGLAFATIRFIFPIVYTHKKSVIKKNVIEILLLIIGVSFTLATVINFSIWSLFFYGVIIIALGEGVLAFKGKDGIFVSLFYKRNYSSFVKLWGDFVLIGFLYELVNWFFPFWIWLPRFDYSHIGVEFLIIVFGYVALFHPMTVFWQLVETK